MVLLLAVCCFVWSTKLRVAFVFDHDVHMSQTIFVPGDRRVKSSFSTGFSSDFCLSGARGGWDNGIRLARSARAGNMKRSGASCRSAS